MYEWSEEHQAVAAAVRRFVDEEIRPILDELEYEDLPPYGVLRKMFATFGMDQLAREQFKRQFDRRVSDVAEDAKRRGGGASGLTLIPVI